jgi:hypothetical protein
MQRDGWRALDSKVRMLVRVDNGTMTFATSMYLLLVRILAC